MNHTIQEPRRAAQRPSAPVWVPRPVRVREPASPSTRTESRQAALVLLTLGLGSLALAAAVVTYFRPATGLSHHLLAAVAIILLALSQRVGGPSLPPGHR